MSAVDFLTRQGISSGRVTRATVHLDRIASNVRNVRAMVGDDVAVLAVIKADGYGHGAIPVARAALGAGATWLGVACVDEGLGLRAAGITAPVLVMGYAAAAELPAAVHGNLTLTLGTLAQCGALAGAAHRSRSTVRVHLKLDTGMGRFGLLPDQLDELARTLEHSPEIIVEGCFTHLARGEENPEYATNQQLAIFDQALRALARHGIKPEIIHAANSGATIAAPGARFNLVRVGLLMYGYHPNPDTASELSLLPALEVQSSLVRVETLPAGSRIGYGHTHTLSTAARIGLVPMGYADGLPRSLSGIGYAVVGGCRVPIVGRISMDQFSVDLSDVGRVDEGDDVRIIGAMGGAAVWADDIAAWAGTIVYEILCGISPRVPRGYNDPSGGLSKGLIA
jgi:alanine racemase